MRSEITKFVLNVCEKYRLNANYFPEDDIWSIHKKGRAVQNFTSDQFYQVPRRARMSQFEPLVRVGMNGNLQSNPNQVFINRKLGKTIA